MAHTYGNRPTVRHFARSCSCCLSQCGAHHGAWPNQSAAQVSEEDNECQHGLHISLLHHSPILA
eukprot:1139640-Pelagomonas_calceolata.AAC.4